MKQERLYTNHHKIFKVVLKFNPSLSLLFLVFVACVHYVFFCIDRYLILFAQTNNCHIFVCQFRRLLEQNHIVLYIYIEGQKIQ